MSAEASKETITDRNSIIIKVSKERLADVTFWVQNAVMKRSVDLDDSLLAEVEQAAALVREKPATVIRLAIRAGLPSVVSRFQAQRPEGYFTECYPLPDDRLRLEEAMSGAGTGPDR